VGVVAHFSRGVIWLHTTPLPKPRRTIRREERYAELEAAYEDRRLTGFLWVLNLARVSTWERLTTPIAVRPRLWRAGRSESTGESGTLPITGWMSLPPRLRVNHPDVLKHGAVELELTNFSALSVEVRITNDLLHIRRGGDSDIIVVPVPPSAGSIGVAHLSVRRR
jgi:hypothetical protein